jgi:hypothetical protein
MKRAFAGLAWLFLLAVLGCQPAELAQPTQSGFDISGIVVDEEDHPIAGAVVRIKATDRSTTADGNGRFAFVGVTIEESVLITAWAPGYYNGGGERPYTSGAMDVEIILRKHTDEDNPDYRWVSAFASAGEEGNCENCHSDPSGILPFDEWAQDAHALSTQNPRFLSMYLGQDVDGNQSPPTRLGYSRDYGSFPLRPDLSQPYFGPGYRLDFPDTTGNCAACHAPVAAIHSAYGTDPTAVSGVGAEGVACDFCHKAWDVRLDPASGLPYLNMPGVLSFEFRRPPEGHQFFAGPFDDVAPGEDTYAPIQRQSQFCAPCHFGSFWDTQIYDSFGEWLESPYSEAASGRTCQDCHMPQRGAAYFALPDQGAAEREPQTIFSHRMPGASDTTLLQNAVTMTLDGRREGERIAVSVTIVNDQTGHHIPTDSPLRQMILLVSATEEEGQALSLLEGSVIPEYGGVGDPANGNYAGLPGTIYAKILMELWTEIAPTGAYWNPTRLVSDNRIPAFGSDSSAFVFAAPVDGPVRIDVRLLFRRAFIALMEQKGWDAPDILMEQQTLRLP